MRHTFELVGAALVLMVAGCIGDPADLLNGEQNQVPVDPGCTVDGDVVATIADAYESGCAVIEVPGGFTAAVSSDGVALHVDRNVEIRGGGGGARVGADGPMMNVSQGATVRLRSLVVEASPGLDPFGEPLVEVHGEVRVEQTRIQGVKMDGAAVIHVGPSGRLELDDGALVNLERYDSGPAAVDCDGGEFEAINDSRISDNRAEVTGGQGLELYGGVIRAEGCEVHVSDSEMTGNSIMVTVDEFSGASDHLWVYGGSLYARSSVVEMSRVRLVENEIAVEIDEAGGVAFGMDVRGGALHLEDSDLTMEEVTIDGNEIDVSLGSGLVNRGDDATIAGVGGGLSARGTGRIRLQRSTVSGNQVLVSGGAEDLDSYAGGGGIVMEAVEADSLLEMENSTVSGNRVGKDATWTVPPFAAGAGVLILGPVETSEPVARLRYVTVVENQGQNLGLAERGGFGLHVDEALRRGLEEGRTGPFVSLVGALFYGNGLLDCGGHAVVTSLLNDPEQGTGYVIRTNLVPNACESWLSDDDAFFMVGANLDLGGLEDNGGTTKTHMPSTESLFSFFFVGNRVDAVNELQPACSGLEGDLTMDQRGRVRPSSSFGPPENRVGCIVGAVDPSPPDE